MSGTYQDPQLLDRSDLDLSQLRKHVREMHKPRFGETVPRSNLDLAGWHARKHHRQRPGHRHRGLFTMIRDRYGRTTGQIPWPEGNFTGRDPVTREQDAADWRAKHPRKEGS